MLIWRLGQRRVAFLLVAGVLSAFYSMFAGFVVVTSIYRLTLHRDVTTPKAVAAINARPEDFLSAAVALRGACETSAGLVLSATTAVLHVSCLLLPLVVLSSLFPTDCRALVWVAGPLVAACALSGLGYAVGLYLRDKSLQQMAAAAPQTPALLINDIATAESSLRVSSIVCALIGVVLAVLFVVATFNATRVLSGRLQRPAA